MALLDFGWNLMKYLPMNNSSEVLCSVKNVFSNGVSRGQGDLKSLAILFAFQVIVPSAIKLVSFTANSMDGYLGNTENSNTITPSLTIPNPTADIVNVTPAEVELVSTIGQVANTE